MRKSNKAPSKSARRPLLADAFRDERSIDGNGVRIQLGDYVDHREALAAGAVVAIAGEAVIYRNETDADMGLGVFCCDSADQLTVRDRPGPPPARSGSGSRNRTLAAR